MDGGSGGWRLRCASGTAAPFDWPTMPAAGSSALVPSGWAQASQPAQSEDTTAGEPISIKPVCQAHPPPLAAHPLSPPAPSASLAAHLLHQPRTPSSPSVNPPFAPHLLLVLKLDEPLGVPALLVHALVQHGGGVHILKHVGCGGAGGRGEGDVCGQTGKKGVRVQTGRQGCACKALAEGSTFSNMLAAGGRGEGEGDVHVKDGEACWLQGAGGCARKDGETEMCVSRQGERGCAREAPVRGALASKYYHHSVARSAS